VILLDTCAVIWDALDPAQLSHPAKAAIERNENELMICDISLWEITMLIAKARLLVDETTAGFLDLVLRARGLHVQAITPEIAQLSATLDASIGGDPADRLIAATALTLNAPLVTADNRLLRAGLLRTIWEGSGKVRLPTVIRDDCRFCS
jgi:PIN domain nuclease of toxin-antitoxin system